MIRPLRFAGNSHRSNSIIQSVKLSVVAIFIVVGFILPSCKAQIGSCDAQGDTCPFQFDGTCDREQVPTCATGDCFDCDICRNFDYDCAGCIETGCYWCPGDATCIGNLYIFGLVASCTSEADYVTDTCENPGNFFSDPLYSAENWVYELSNVVPVWQMGYTGAGIGIRVNDNGVDATHPEFADRFDIEASCEFYLPESPDDTHGTNVASVAAAGANNGECAVGIAPGATVSSCSFIENDDFLDFRLDMFDISQNSYGTDACTRDPDPIDNLRRLQQVCPFTFQDTNVAFPCDVCGGEFMSPSITVDCQISIIEHCERYYENDPVGCLEFLDLLIVGDRCFYNVLEEDDQQRMTNAIINGRGGLGTVFLFAAGNEYDVGEVINFEGQLNTRFTITVGAVGKDGLHASYSTPGAALFLTAPGGDNENVSNHITALVGGGCHDATIGTSFSCPVVSGVVALMLEANPNLGWRDVQGILALTSRMVENDPDDDTRITNAAGFKHSNFYGFGIVDAEAAVLAALEWKNFGEEKMILGDSGSVALEIPDDASQVTSTVEILPAQGEDCIIESVVVYLSLMHESRGDLDIVLTSPQGTTSLLVPGNRPETTQLVAPAEWKLLTVRNWGESPIGDWSLSISDISPGAASECIDIPWAINFFGLDLNCGELESFNLCPGGMFDAAFFDQLVGEEGRGDQVAVATDDNGRTLSDACCACGGGNTDTGVDFVNELVMWRMVIYAHQDPDTISSAPSTSPSIKPSIPPSASPSTGSSSPSGSPSNSPTSTVTEVEILSTSPSMGPSLSTLPTFSFSPSISFSPSTSSSPSVTSSPTTLSIPPTITSSPSVTSSPTITSSPTVTWSPTMTALPTITSFPTATDLPFSPQPTTKDTKLPSALPTTLPTDSPSVQPTDVSTDSPTNVPNEQPTAQPTNFPTDRPISTPSPTVISPTAPVVTNAPIMTPPVGTPSPSNITTSPPANVVPSDFPVGPPTYTSICNKFHFTHRSCELFGCYWCPINRHCTNHFTPCTVGHLKRGHNLRLYRKQTHFLAHQKNIRHTHIPKSKGSISKKFKYIVKTKRKPRKRRPRRNRKWNGKGKGKGHKSKHYHKYYKSYNKKRYSHKGKGYRGQGGRGRYNSNRFQRPEIKIDIFHNKKQLF